MKKTPEAGIKSDIIDKVHCAIFPSLYGINDIQD
jgi:hypothetical protein